MSRRWRTIGAAAAYVLGIVGPVYLQTGDVGAALLLLVLGLAFLFMRTFAPPKDRGR